MEGFGAKDWDFGSLRESHFYIFRAQSQVAFLDLGGGGGGPKPCNLGKLCEIAADASHSGHRGRDVKNIGFA